MEASPFYVTPEDEEPEPVELHVREMTLNLDAARPLIPAREQAMGPDPAPPRNRHPDSAWALRGFHPRGDPYLPVRPKQRCGHGRRRLLLAQGSRRHVPALGAQEEGSTHHMPDTCIVVAAVIDDDLNGRGRPARGLRRLGGGAKAPPPMSVSGRDSRATCPSGAGC